MTYDFDLFIIGAGSGGVRTARFSADFGARVAVAESRYLGGTCVNVGCMPKKYFVYSASFHDEFRQSKGYGWSVEEKGFDWQNLVANKDHEIRRLNGIYRALLINSGVTLFEEHARIVDAHTVEAGGKRYTTERILIATGGWPSVPDLPGREHIITSNEAFYLKELPKRMIIVGGGYIAVEFASIFHGMGVQVSLMYRGELFLRGFDMDVREHLRDEMLKRGHTLQFNADIASIDKNSDGSLKVTLKNGSIHETDCVFYATGRRPMLDNLGLENVDVELDARGFVKVDELFQTTEPSVYAIGDVIGRVQLTPVALAEGMALARKLYQPQSYKPLNYDLIASAVYSLPNVGAVGLSEEQARKQGHKLKIFRTTFKPTKLSLTQETERTLMKLVVDADTDKVLGCHMVGPEAPEQIQCLAIALKAGATKSCFDDTIGIHPTAAEEWVTMRSPTRED
ncbi:glutathione reductase (NADPH) [Pseudomonas duriflava]|uniref:Glutathione reductase (NADPH) n=1 Tax=Pseudomonas duriflava TaxID=459528 RepID=A0A562Q472_9PSED|nr:glutathione-disulfide reductase [Pseudomonas duriflava]TWI50950.1 glutathione reductase (NADPH) [Pseudomonas duriflava]